jgi:hypothetical protein
MRTTIGLSIALGAAVAGMALAGCGTAVEGTGPGTQMNALAATWVSQGSDVAPLLAGAPFNNVKITATFKSDNTYTVVGIDKDNKETDYAGTFTTTPTSVAGIVDITLAQVMPSTATAVGMYQIDTTVTPARMTYEVVQTQPTNGLTPPDPMKGFGSTIFNGQQIATLIQKYSRQ